MANTSDMDVVTEARRLAKLSTDLKLKLPTGVVPADVTKTADTTQGQLDDIDATRRSMRGKVNGKNANILKLKENIKRIRLGVKAEYGEDSDEYEKVGGTRSSERKKPVHKKPASAG